MQQGLPMRALTPIRPFRDRRLLEGVIARLPAFGQLSREELDVLAGYSQLRDFRRGATIAKRGEPFPGVIALVEGSAKLAMRRNDGEEKVSRILEPGESFGFAAMLLQRPSPVDVMALQNCVVATIPAMPVMRLMEQRADFAVAIARTLAGRVLELIGELEACVQHSSLQRLACFLDSRAEPAAERGKWLVRLPATKSTIAARLGVKKETMSRMLRELVSRGVISVAGPEIAILDREGLARLAAIPS
jgi:CRP/FNR family transcriptional regulator, dissimilatory nitrate respiration regulator